MAARKVLTAGLILLYGLGPLYGQKQRAPVSGLSYSIGVYQKYVSGLRPLHCPMYPSCSRYGRFVFQRYGLAKGAVLTADRLLRCGHDHLFYPLTLQDNGFRLIDLPVRDPKWLDSVLYRVEERVFPYSLYAPAGPWKQKIEFVSFLMQRRLYEAALLEIYKALYYTRGPDSERYSPSVPTDLYINLIRSLKALERHEDALWEYEHYFPQLKQHDPVIVFEICKIWLDLDNFSQAVDCFHKVGREAKDTFLRYKALIYEGYSYAHLGQLDSARACFQRVPDRTPLASFAQSNLQVVKSLERVKYKKPVVAGLLAIIPGAGYLYAGHWQTAISSLSVNALMFYATYTSLKVNNYGVALLSGIGALTFYIGNIVGSVRSARRYNERMVQQRLAQMDLPQ